MRLAEQMLSFPPKGRGACKIPEKVKSQRVRETERADLEGCARCGKTVRASEATQETRIVQHIQPQAGEGTVAS